MRPSVDVRRSPGILAAQAQCQRLEDFGLSLDVGEKLLGLHWAPS